MNFNEFIVDQQVLGIVILQPLRIEIYSFVLRQPDINIQQRCNKYSN